MNRLIAEGEERWATARRVTSDDHPKDCPCIRDHLENAFLLGMVEGEERLSAERARLEARVRELESDLAVAERNVDSVARVLSPDGQIDRLEARVAELTAALRRTAFRTGDAGSARMTRCLICYEAWPVFAPERHADGCLVAAPVEEGEANG